MTEHIKLEVTDGKIAIATMVNGENRFRTAYVEEWMKVLDAVEGDTTVKGLIIQGQGKHFSLGLDLDYLNTKNDEYLEHFQTKTSELFWRLSIFPIPTVAAVNGHAFGGGAFLALSCDYRVMRSDRGWLCWPETALNVRFPPKLLALLRTYINMALEHIKLDVTDDKIAIATMVNGENRFRTSYVEEWMKTLDAVERDTTVKGLIIQGQGKHFSLGLDLDFLGTQTDEYMDDFIAKLSQLFWRLYIFPIPTVAAMNGHSYGAGAFLALSCDYRVMRSDQGWLCWPETALSIRFTPKLMALVRAKLPSGCSQRDAIIFSKKLSAQEAKTLQLVDVVTKEDKLLDSAAKLIWTALGPKGLDRTILTNVKRDIYGNSILSKM